ncbi:MAG: glycine cleavage system aminomethyltransferase GcvT [Candidatus Omnitrophota bacterium]
MDTGLVHKLPLHEKHQQAGARFGSFGGWEVPLYYSGIVAEHLCVRERAGLFDISHMGIFRLTGDRVIDFLDTLLPRRVLDLEAGRALYMPLLNAEGGVVDDVILYRFPGQECWLIVNAGNTEKDEAWFRDRIRESGYLGKEGNVRFENLGGRKCLLSVQGPEARGIVEKALAVELGTVRYYRFLPTEDGLIARTGYTGEDGFEVLADVDRAETLWGSFLQHGTGAGLMPVGFGARDTLRLEAGMPLYGHELNDHTTPSESGIGWAVDLQKKSFWGRQAVAYAAAQKLSRTLIGWEVQGRGIPREGCRIEHAGRTIGTVTSGSFSPTFKKPIGMALVEMEFAKPGSSFEIYVREQRCDAAAVALPFYRRKK